MRQKASPQSYAPYQNLGTQDHPAIGLIRRAIPFKIRTTAKMLKTRLPPSRLLAPPHSPAGSFMNLP